MKLQPDISVKECSNKLLGLSKSKPFMGILFFLNRLFGSLIIRLSSPVLYINGVIEKPSLRFSLFSFHEFNAYCSSFTRNSTGSCRDGPAP
jgi:hypothetical protein